MPSKVNVNKFPDGLDKDSDDKIRKNTTYKDAHNVQLTGDGKYGGLQNLRGTTLIDTVLSTVTHATVNVMGAYKARTLVDSTSIEDCIYVFYSKDVASVYTFLIDVFRVSDSTTYNIYSEVVTSSIMLSLIDAFVIGETGVDTLYFTVTGIDLGRVRCTLNTSTPIIVKRQTELLKRYPSNPLLINDIIYNPKSESATSASHTIEWSELTSEDLSEQQIWTGKAILDNEIEAPDDFDVVIYWSITWGVTNVDYVDTKVDLKFPLSGSSIAGFPKFQSQIGPYTGNLSENGFETINITSAPYNTDPIFADIEVNKTDGSGSGVVNATVLINSITEVAGGDSYFRGINIQKEVILN